MHFSERLRLWSSGISPKETFLGGKTCFFLTNLFFVGLGRDWLNILGVAKQRLDCSDGFALGIGMIDKQFIDGFDGVVSMCSPNLILDPLFFFGNFWVLAVFAKGIKLQFQSCMDLCFSVVPPSITDEPIKVRADGTTGECVCKRRVSQDRNICKCNKVSLSSKTETFKLHPSNQYWVTESYI